MAKEVKTNGRTFWDLVHENKAFSFLIFLIGLAVLYWSLKNGFNVTTSGITKSPLKPDTTIVSVTKEQPKISSPHYPSKPTIVFKPDTTPKIRGKNILAGNVSGGNVQIGDNNVMMREQRHLTDITKSRIVALLDSCINANKLAKTTNVEISYPASSEEAQRFADEIGIYIKSKGFNFVNTVSFHDREESDGFFIRYSNVIQVLQIYVGFKDVGKYKL